MLFQTDESNRVYLNVEPPNGDVFIMYINPVNGFPEPGQELPNGGPLPEINGQPCENDGNCEMLNVALFAISV